MNMYAEKYHFKWNKELQKLLHDKSANKYIEKFNAKHQ